MKKSRMLSVLVAFVLLMSCFTMVPTSATETTYTEEVILVGAEKGQSLDFVSMAEATMQGYGLNGATVSKDGGMKLTISDSATNGYANLTGFNNTIAVNSALKLTFVMPSSGNLEADIRDSSNRLRIYTYNGEFGCNSARGGSLTARETYTVIIKRTGDAIEAYLKDSDDAAYTQIFASGALTTTSNSMFRLGLTGVAGDSLVCKELTQYSDIGTYISKETILSNLTTWYDCDFDASFDGSTYGYKPTSGDLTTTEDGLSVQASQVINARQSDRIPTNGAAMFRVKVPESSSLEVAMGDSQYRIVLLIDKTNGIRYKDSSGTVTLANSAALSGLLDQWNTFIIKDNGTNFSIYRSINEEKGYRHLVDTNGKQTNSLDGLQLAAGSAGFFMDYMKIFMPGDSVAIVPSSDGMTMLHYGDFSAERNILADAQIQSTTAILNNGKLDLSAGTETYNYYDAGIPAGGYAEISFNTTNGIAPRFIQDGIDLPLSVGLATATTKTVHDGAWTATTSSLKLSPATQHVYKISRSVDGSSFNIWRKSEGDSGWLKLFDGVTARTSSNSNRMEITGQGTVDYVKVYAPKQNGVVFTDGKNTTSIVTEAKRMEYPTEMRIVANTSETGVMIVGSYIGTSLDKAILEPVAANIEKQVVADVSTAERARVFLWNSTSELQPLTSATFEVTIGK